jgi:hypothetical protein
MALRFYGDESEDKEQKVHTLGGFLGWADEWDHLQEEWIDRVKPTGVSAYHMTDCDNGGGEFSDAKGWTKTDRTQLTIDLIEIICRHKVFLIGMGLYIDDYKTLGPVTDDGEMLGHDKWHLVFQGALREAAIHVDKIAPPEETIAFFFDWQMKQGMANDLFESTQNESSLPWRNRLGTLTFGHKEFGVPGSLPLLQVADIAALEVRKSLAHPITQPKLPERRSLARLKQCGGGVIKIFDKPYFDALYELKRKSLGLPNKAEETELRLRNLPRPRRPHHE